MPELPEMENYRRHLSAWLNGRTITALAAERPKRLNHPVNTLHDVLVGGRIQSIARRGKSLAIHVDGVQPSYCELYIHLMLGGRITLSYEDQPGAITMGLDETRWVQFHLGLGRMDAMSAAELDQRWRKLGVEPLSDQYHPGLWREAYHSARRPIKACLTDQHVVAGIGNVYSDEILYKAKLYPGTPAYQLTFQDWTRVGEIVPAVLAHAVESGGVGDPIHSEDALSGGYRVFLQVHYRAGQPCGAHGVVTTSEIAGRTTYWCPEVQSSPL